MEFIKTILEKAVITDGKLDVEGTMKLINAEIPKHLVPKGDYNTKVEELKTANGTIATLKKDNADNETLQSTIKTHEKTISDLQKAQDNLKKTYSLRDAISKTGCTDPDYLIYKQGGLEKFTFDKDGEPVGVEDVVKGYKESNPLLFPTGRKEQGYSPAGGSGSAGSNPFAKETFNLTEQGKLFRENPEQARALAAAAGTTI